MFDKIIRWLWVRGNKKPPTALSSYLNIAVSWILVGFLFILLLFMVVGVTSSDGRINIAAAIVVIVFLVSWIIYFVYATLKGDKINGVYDAIHEAKLKEWHEKRQEYGLEKKKE